MTNGLMYHRLQISLLIRLVHVLIHVRLENGGMGSRVEIVNVHLGLHGMVLYVERSIVPLDLRIIMEDAGMTPDVQTELSQDRMALARKYHVQIARTGLEACVYQRLAHMERNSTHQHVTVTVLNAHLVALVQIRSIVSANVNQNHFRDVHLTNVLMEFSALIAIFLALQMNYSQMESVYNYVPIVT